MKGHKRGDSVCGNHSHRRVKSRVGDDQSRQDKTSSARVRAGKQSRSSPAGVGASVTSLSSSAVPVPSGNIRCYKLQPGALHYKRREDHHLFEELLRTANATLRGALTDHSKLASAATKGTSISAVAAACTSEIERTEDAVNLAIAQRATAVKVMGGSEFNLSELLNAGSVKDLRSVFPNLPADVPTGSMDSMGEFVASQPNRTLDISHLISGNRPLFLVTSKYARSTCLLTKASGYLDGLLRVPSPLRRLEDIAMGCLRENLSSSGSSASHDFQGTSTRSIVGFVDKLAFTSPTEAEWVSLRYDTSLAPFFWGSKPATTTNDAPKWGLIANLHVSYFEVPVPHKFSQPTSGFCIITIEQADDVAVRNQSIHTALEAGWIPAGGTPSPGEDIHQPDPVARGQAEVSSSKQLQPIRKEAASDSNSGTDSDVDYSESD